MLKNSKILELALHGFKTEARVFLRPFLAWLFLFFLVGAVREAAEAHSVRLGFLRQREKVMREYVPTVLDSYEQVQKVYESMSWQYFKPGARRWNPSQCYMRAHLWTYDFFKNQNSLKAMKVFVFYTHAYKEWYQQQARDQEWGESEFGWWYHVAPYVLSRSPGDPQSKVQEWVLDPSFDDLVASESDAEKPLNMKAWTDLFVESKKPCRENVRYEDFRCEVEKVGSTCRQAIVGQEHCYLVKVPATLYTPDDVVEYQRGKIRHFYWSHSSLQESVQEAGWGREGKSYWKSQLKL
jgi:hypothetical protein